MPSKQEIEAAAKVVWAIENQVEWDALYAKEHRKNEVRDKAEAALTAAERVREDGWEKQLDAEKKAWSEHTADRIREARTQPETGQPSDPPGWVGKHYVGNPIPDEAVEAVARTLAIRVGAWKSAYMDPAREALEAAAPIIRQQALEEAKARVEAQATLVGPYDTEALAIYPTIYLPLTGSAPFTDLSGWQHNGTATGTAPRSPGPLTVGDTGATDFDGTDDKVTTTYTTRRNYLTNPSFQTNTTNWLAAGGGTTTLTRVADGSGIIAVDGGYYLAINTDGTAAYQGATTGDNAVPASTTYTASAYVKAVPGLALVIGILEYDSGGSYIGQTQTNWTTATNDWERVSVTRAFSASGVKARLSINAQGTLDYNAYVDCCQIEAAATAGTYFPTVAQLASGKAGWTGTANASASSIGCFADGTERTFMAWSYSDSTAYQVSMSGVANGANANNVGQIDSGGGFHIYIGSGGYYWPPGTVPIGAWFHWVFVVDRKTTNTAKLYVNGALISSQAITDAWAPCGVLQIGCAADGTQQWDGMMRGPAVYHRTPTATEISDLYDAGKAQRKSDPVRGRVLNYNQAIDIALTAIDGSDDE
jgi:hypothetical protein